VQAEALVKHYTSGKEVIEAVRGVDLRIETGEVFGFLGPNGAGKSTTVRMLTTLLSITSGTASACTAAVDPARGGLCPITCSACSTPSLLRFSPVRLDREATCAHGAVSSSNLLPTGPRRGDA
jgi:energy-coupling factor transporter ATP-binding protein EcfA2